MSEFFVRRPIVAIVIAILMTLIGGVCILALPIAQYPQIAPPEIQVQTHYTGADALTIEQSVAAPIEQQMSGVDNMNYMYSINANSGDIRLIVDFDVATDPNIDQVLTQLRVAQAQSQLPADVNNYGLTVKKSTTAPLMLVSLYSPKGTYDGTLSRELRLHQSGRSTDAHSGNWQCADFRRRPIRDALVGQARSAREAWHHRAGHHHRGAEAEHGESRWTDRRRTDSEWTEIHLHGAGAGSIANAGGIRRNCRSGESGRLICAGERYRADRSRRANLQFEGATERTTGGNSRLYQLPGTNAVKAAQGVRKLMAEAKQRFPADMDYAVSLDQTLSVTEGMQRNL